MKTVSDDVEELFAQLVAWEMLGRADIDPKVLLRQVPLADLSIVSQNLMDMGEDAGSYVCTRMVSLELLYRTGRLGGDWSFKRDGLNVELTFIPKEPIKRLIGIYRVEPVGVVA